jgi:hypothetical protein
MNNLIFTLSIVVLLLNACATTTNIPQQDVKDPQQNENITEYTWMHLDSKNYELQSPGLGRSEKYITTFGWADVYEYNLEKYWQDGVSDPLFSEHFQQVVGDIYRAERSGIYQDVKLNHVGDEIINGVTFRHAVLHYKQQEKNLESHVYMSGVQGQLVKFRITVKLPFKLEEKESVARFIKDRLDNILLKSNGNPNII